MSALREQVAIWILLAYFNNRDRFDLVDDRGPPYADQPCNDSGKV